MNAIRADRRARAAVAAAVAALIAAAPAYSQTDIARMSGAGHDIRKVVIAEGIYQFMTLRDSYVRQLNSVVIVNADDVLVFDTDTRPSTARLILAEIRKITAKPVRYVVNSHWHPDHWSGNEVYAKAYPGVTIIATTKTLEFMQNVANRWPRQFQDQLAAMELGLKNEIESGRHVDGTPLTAEQRSREEADLRDYRGLVEEIGHLRRVYPTLTYDGGLTLEHGGRVFRFMSVTGDAEGSTVLFLPREKVLVTGDVVSYPIPYITPPPTRHAETLRALAQLDADVIVPGHGPAFHDKEFLELELALLESVTAGVRKALQGGAQTLEEVQKAVTAEDLRERFTHGDADLEPRFRDRVRALVRIAIREARDGQDLP